MPLEVTLDEVLGWAECFNSQNATALDRLGAAIFVASPDPRGRLMALFAAYLDASGNSLDQPFVIVTGYLANWVQWKYLDIKWKDLHKEYSLDLPFHMSDFVEANLHPASYVLQKKARQDYVTIAKTPGAALEFLNKLTAAQLLFANCGVSCIVNMNIYNEVSSVLELQEVIPPYALGARICVARIRKWAQEFDIQDPVECIFEEGDFGQGKFTELMVSEGNDAPIYKKKKDFAGLQAADHYAWEQAFFLKKELRGQQFPARDVFTAQLNLIPKLHLTATAAQLIKLCEDKGINPRTATSYVK